MRERVLKAINEIVGEKRIAIKHPTHALDVEVFNKFEESEFPEVKKALNELINEDIIRWGQTDSNKWLLPR